jgi:hypothetical protein
MQNNKWETLNRGANQNTQRLKVDGGYIYHREEYYLDYQENLTKLSTSMCFVPLNSTCNIHNESRLIVCYSCFLEEVKNAQK